MEVIISVFTPTFNREKTLLRLYESLRNQTFKEFEWIIVNDGSTDQTDELVKKWRDENYVRIIYIKQENNGKHIAMNRAVKSAKGQFFTTVDSDDYLLPDALAILIQTWHNIPTNEWRQYVSVKSDCIDMKTGEKIGPTFPGGKIICNYLDARYKKKINYEMQSLSRVEVLREYPNPEILGGPQNGGLRFYPETIWQDLAARKYETIFIDKCTCAYQRDSSESLLGRGKKYNRYRENIYLWSHILNDNMDYFIYKPSEFIKAMIGISMDGIFNGLSVKEILSRLNKKRTRFLVLLLYPLGYCAYLAKR